MIRSWPLRAAFLLLVLPALAGSAAALDLELVGAWGQEPARGQPGEIGVRLRAEHGGTVRIEVQDGDLRVVAEEQLSAGQAVTRWLPVAATGEVIQVRAEETRAGGRKVSAEVATRRRSSKPSVVTLVAALPQDLRADGGLQALPEAQTLYPPLEFAPHHPATYRGVAAVVLDPVALGRLDPEQTGALQGHLEDCGRLLAVGFGGAEFELLRDHAGCSAKLVRRVDTPAQAGSVLRDLLASTPPPLPTPRALRRLWPRHTDSPTASLALFALYFASLITAVVLRARWVVLVLLPPLAAATVWAGFPGGGDHAQKVWAEMDASDVSARYVAVSRIQGHGSGSVTLQLPPSAPVPPGLSGELRRSGPTGDRRLLQVRTRYRGVDWVASNGTFGLTPSLQLRAASGDLAPAVVNPNPVSSAAGFAAWDGALYALPALAPDETWSPGDQAPSLAAAPHLTLLRQAAPGPDPAVLLPLDTAAFLPDTTTATQGWLLLRLSTKGDDR